MMKYFTGLCAVMLALSIFTYVDMAAAAGKDLDTLQNYFDALSTPSVDDDEEKSLRKFQIYFDKIREDYVEDITNQELIDAAIEGMVKILDKHSQYLKPKDSDEVRILSTGEFSGIGAEVTKDDETKYVKVITPIDDTPAYEAGIQPGDLFKEVDGKNTKEYNGEEVDLATAINWIRGPIGTTVKLKIIRNGIELPETVDIVRGWVHVIKVKSQLLDGNIAHIRVTSFNKDVTNDVMDAINKERIKLEENNPNMVLQGLILDLRHNPGGLLTEAISMVDLFVSEGNIVHTKGRHGLIAESADATANLFVRPSMPIVVLIDSGSASASEIVAGSLLDLNRATLIGTKSYGKGSVQTIYSLSENYGLKLTTQHYYTASNRKIHGIGIEPNVVIALPEDYTKEKWSDVDPQIESAIEVLHTGYDEHCVWSVVSDDSPDGYGVTKSCDAETTTP